MLEDTSIELGSESHEVVDDDQDEVSVDIADRVFVNEPSVVGKCLDRGGLRDVRSWCAWCVIDGS